MSVNNDHAVKVAERGLPDGLGSENTQSGPDVIHHGELTSLVYGLGSAETQSDAGAPGHTAIYATEDGSANGLPLGLGSDNTQDGPPAPHPFEGDSLEFGLGSAETQLAHSTT